MIKIENIAPSLWDENLFITKSTIPPIRPEITLAEGLFEVTGICGNTRNAPRKKLFENNLNDSSRINPFDIKVKSRAVKVKDNTILISVIFIISKITPKTIIRIGYSYLKLSKKKSGKLSAAKIQIIGSVDKICLEPPLMNIFDITSPNSVEITTI